MRALPFALLLVSACLSSPDGVPRSWPPPLATTDVAAIATGDLDGDGTADVLVLVAGTADTGAGVYFLRGGADVHASAATPLSSFTSYRPLPQVAAPATGAVLSIASTPTAVFVYDAGGQAQLTAFQRADLTITGDHSTSLAVTSSDTIALRAIAFPGNNTRLGLVAGNAVEHIDPTSITGATLTINPMPAPGNGAWSGPQVVATYASGTDQYAVVASRGSVDRSVIPTKPPEMGGMFAWTSVRSGMAWIGQTAADLGGGHDDVVGFQPAPGNPGSLCALDPASGSGAACVATMIGAPSDVTVIAGKLDGDPKLDVAIVQGGSGAATVQIVPNAMLSGTSLAATPLAPQPTTISGAHAALYGNGVLLVGANGAAACVAATGACQ